MVLVGMCDEETVTEFRNRKVKQPPTPVAYPTAKDLVHENLDSTEFQPRFGSDEFPFFCHQGGSHVCDQGYDITKARNQVAAAAAAGKGKLIMTFHGCPSQRRPVGDPACQSGRWRLVADNEQDHGDEGQGTRRERKTQAEQDVRRMVVLVVD
jgi:hypothetical protein